MGFFTSPFGNSSGRSYAAGRRDTGPGAFTEVEAL